MNVDERMGHILVGTRLIASPLADRGCLHAEGDAIKRVPTEEPVIEDHKKGRRRFLANAVPFYDLYSFLIVMNTMKIIYWNNNKK